MQCSETPHCNLHLRQKNRAVNYLILRSGMTIPLMTKKSFQQPPPDALAKIEMTLASTDSVPPALTISLFCPIFNPFHLLFGVTSYADMPAYTSFSRLSSLPRSRISKVNTCYGGTVRLRLEPMAGMLLSRSSWRLYHGTAPTRL